MKNLNLAHVFEVNYGCIPLTLQRQTSFPLTLLAKAALNNESSSVLLWAGGTTQRQEVHPSIFTLSRAAEEATG